jgi:ankyrin repeat protein
MSRQATPTSFLHNTLHHAIQIGNFQQVKHLVETTNNVDQKKGVAGETPLHLAAKSGSLEIAHLLLSYSADPNISDVFSVRILIHQLTIE